MHVCAQRERETRDKRQETRDKKQETRNKRATYTLTLTHTYTHRMCKRRACVYVWVCIFSVCIYTIKRDAAERERLLSTNREFADSNALAVMSGCSVDAGEVASLGDEEVEVALDREAPTAVDSGAWEADEAREEVQVEEEYFAMLRRGVSIGRLLL
jgi:hypothetical protein